MAHRKDELDERANIGSTGRGGLNDELLKDKTSMRTRDEEVVPVVEEELAVGKRTVETGGVRVHKTTTETPIEENVSLHEERVHVERRPVDRPVDAADMRAFENETIEMREMAEEAVVEKRARVVEEVVVGKEARERTEHISDTVRRTDVEIEPLTGNTMRQGWDNVDTSCRTHFKQNYASSGWDYDSGYSHAYRYGYDLAGSGRDWSTMEGDVRSNWETKNKGTWDKFKDAIRYGFDQGR
ncbi:MAG TPA: YsnF/AvaK domain-containing protein [Thermoanaerobaculia bacterium]